MLYCKDCHFSTGGMWALLDPEGSKCLHPAVQPPSKLSLVTGKRSQEVRFCFSARNDRAACGPDATLFVPKS